MKRPVPEFKDNKEFAEFVDNNDMSEYDWADAPEFEIQHPVKKPVTLRLYPYVIDGIKKIAKERGMPYQTLIGHWLSERLSNGKILEVKNKMIMSSVSTRGQLVIPYKLRKKYGIKPHSQVRWIDTEQGLMLIPLTNDPVTSSRGMLKGTKVSTRSLLEAKRNDRALEERRERKNE